MPSLEVRHVRDSGGGNKAVVSAEALTIQEHGGEDWQWATPTETAENQADFIAALEKVSRRTSPPGQSSS